MTGRNTPKQIRAKSAPAKHASQAKAMKTGGAKKAGKAKVAR
jgi:hypothetical protein